MGAIIFARPVGIEQLIVPRHKLLPSVRVSPDPLRKGVLDSLLFLLGQGRFFGIKNPALLAVRVGHGVVDAHIAQVQRILQNPIGVGTLRAVGHIGVYVVVGRLGFSADAPLRSKRREMHLNTPAQVIRRLKGFLHELLNVFLVDPGCAQANLNFRSVQILRLGRTERLHIGQIGRIGRCCLFRFPQFLAHIAGEILIGSLPLVFHRVPEDNALQAVNQRRLVHAGQLLHIRQINTGFFRDGERQCFGRGIYGGHDLMGLDGALGKDVRLALQLFFLVQLLQRTQQVVGAVVLKCQRIGAAVDKAVFCRKIIVERVQLCLCLPDCAVRSHSVHLEIDQVVQAVTQFHQPLDALRIGRVQRRPAHQAVLTVVDLSVHDGIAVVFDIRICGNAV